MGYNLHHAIVVTSWNAGAIAEAHAKAIIYCGALVSPISKATVNHWQSFFVAPDGSKEGWEESDHGDRGRAALVEWLESKRHEDGSTPLKYAEIEFGADDETLNPASVLHSSDEPPETEPTGGEIGTLRADVERLRKLLGEAVASQFIATTYKPEGPEAGDPETDMCGVCANPWPCSAPCWVGRALGVGITNPDPNAELAGKVGGEPERREWDAAGNRVVHIEPPCDGEPPLAPPAEALAGAPDRDGKPLSSSVVPAVAATGQYVEGWLACQEAANLAVLRLHTETLTLNEDSVVQTTYILNVAAEHVRALAPPAQPVEPCPYACEVAGHRGRHHAAQPVDAAPSKAEPAGYQARVARWLGTTFDPAALTDRWERASRVVEEAIELGQADGLIADDVGRIALRVFDRPMGEPTQEAGGLMVTLLAWAAGRGVDLDAVTLTEIERIEQPEVVERIRRKQAEKAAAGTGRNYAAPPKAEELVVCHRHIGALPHPRESACVNPRPAPEGSTK